MKYQSKTEEEDYLNLHLFMVSNNPIVIKQRKKAKVLAIVLYVILGAYFFKEELTAFFIFIVFAVVFYIFYFVLLEKSRYKSFYKKNILTNFSNKIGQSYSIEFKEDCIELVDSNTTSQLKYSGLEIVEEIKDYYFFKLKTGERVFLPKRIIHNPEEFSNKLSNIENKFNIKHEKNIDWKWK